MSHARLHDAELLASLQEAFFLFEQSGRSVMLTARQAIGDTQGWLESRQRHWSAEVARLLRDLQLCLAAGGGEDCGHIAAALDAARSELDTAEHWIHEVERAAATYGANEPRFAGVIDRQCSQARAYLSDKHGIVSGYADGRGAAAAPGAAGRAAASGGPTAPSLSSYAAHGDAFSDVPLGKIEEPAFAAGEFQQADLRDMRQSFAQLPQVQRAIQNGTIDQLVAASPAMQRTYDWFYGGESIKLEWQNGRYAITNGKHRVYLARTLGLPNVPAKIIGPP